MTDSSTVTDLGGHPAPVTGPIGILDAAARLARLGFLMINGTEPWEPGGAQLLVALRDRPTLVHFDPEIVQHWRLVSGRGAIADLGREVPLPVRRPFSWGTIRVADRLDVYNSFLTFGGELEADRVDEHTAVCVLRSPAPIGRSTGHSQEADPLSGAIGSFFARMKIPVEDTPGVEAQVGALSPVELYALFLHVQEQRRLLTHRADPAAVDDAVTRWLLREKQRVAVSQPDAWATGVALAGSLGLDRA